VGSRWSHPATMGRRVLASVGGEVQTEAGEIVSEQQQDGDRYDDFGGGETGKANLQGLRNWADEINGVWRNEGEDRASTENIEKSDDGNGNQDCTWKMARGIAGLAGKNGGVLETAERAESHFAEYAEIEKT